MSRHSKFKLIFVGIFFFHKTVTLFECYLILFHVRILHYTRLFIWHQKLVKIKYNVRKIICFTNSYSEKYFLTAQSAGWSAITGRHFLTFYLPIRTFSSSMYFFSSFGSTNNDRLIRRKVLSRIKTVNTFICIKLFFSNDNSARLKQHQIFTTNFVPTYKM